jgi:hypothetical protein
MLKSTQLVHLLIDTPLVDTFLTLLALNQINTL